MEETGVQLMKDRMLFTIILSLVVILPALESTKTVCAVVGVINVPGDYATIQAAINHASSGYTIVVHDGTYVENVVVNKSVSLFGENRERTFIDGNQSNSVVNVTANDVALEGFTIKNSGMNAPDSGIYVEGSSRVIIRNNTFTDNSNAVSLRFCTDNAVLNNTMFSNDGYGVYLSSSANNAVSDNTISSNDLGVFLFSCSANTLDANVFFDNHYGIFLFQSVGDVISGNSIYSNDFGIYLLASTNNTIFHNNIDDIIQASSDSVNYWNSTGEGNHWRDYLGQDFNQDGIGDQPYMIDERNQDSCPLIGRFSDFRVTSDGKTHHVSTISNSLISDFEFKLGLETGNKIVRFNATGAENSPSFCRIGIPTELLSYPYILLVGDEEIAPTVLSSSNETYVRLYIMNIRKNQTIIIISSKALSLYNGLLENFTRLQMNLQNLSAIYESILISYTVVLGNYTQLQEDFASMNTTYYALQSSFAEMITTYDELASNFSSLRTELNDINTMYSSLLGNCSTLSNEYNQLQESFNVLNASYQNLWGLNVTHYELASNYSKLQTQLSSLNATYNLLLSNYTLVTVDYGKLQQRFDTLNASYQDLFGLNATYQDLLNSLQILSTSYGQLQDSYQAMNASYQTHLQHYSENVTNIQNLIYIFAAMTAILIVTTIYLSKRAHTNMTRKRNDATDD
jgi:parallel beta-helix repeat protein